MKLAIGCDEAAYDLKQLLKKHLADAGHDVTDFGTHDAQPVLYPDVAISVAEQVAQGAFERALLLCGTGIGMAISANKVRGIRAAQGGPDPGLRSGAFGMSAHRRRYALRMGEVQGQGQGYIGQALGMADILAEEELESYGCDDSCLPMSGMATYTPGMEMSGGSLGQGLTIAVGMALGLRLQKNPAFIYNSMSDGELDEGATWEAAMPAAHHGLSNLVCMVDINNQQADGPSGQIMRFEPVTGKWAAFDAARQHAGAQPRMILCDTLMGKGVPFLEAREKNHFIRVDPPEWQQALAILDEQFAATYPGAPA